MTLTSIQWTDKTWNPVRGCSIVSPGCVNCYAMKQAHRFNFVKQLPEGGFRAGPYFELTKETKAGPQWNGRIVCDEAKLLEPLSWRKPCRVFVNSMSDLFHEDVPDAFIALVFSVMASSDHTYQVLTKRAERMRNVVARLRWKSGFGFVEFGGRRSLIARLAFFDDADPWERMAGGGRSSAPMPGFVPKNVWLGVSCEDQQRFNERLSPLRDTPAAVRFLSCEPLLGPIDFLADTEVGVLNVLKPYEESPGIDWVIVGGESGPGSRPMQLEWAESIITQCREARVRVFVKQLGSSWRGISFRTSDGSNQRITDLKAGDPSEWPEGLRVREWPGARV
jgi:protein gp37